MFNIIKFELTYRLRRPATYAYFIILFIMCFLFASTDSVSIGGATGNVMKNAPYPVNQSVMIMMIFGTMIVSAVMGVPVFRDFEYNFHEIMFATPVKKFQYLLGRFIGSYLICILIFSGIILGLMVGASVIEYMPWTVTVKKGPFMLMTYVQPFINYILPNSLILGILFFSLGSLFRSQLAIYVQGVIVFVLYLIIINLRTDVENDPTFALLDPFGFSASFYQTRYWTTAEKNTLLVQLNDLLLYNRLLWIGISIVIGTVCYRFFKFSKSGLSFGKKKKLNDVEEEKIQSLTLPKVVMDYSRKARVKQWLHLVRFDFVSVIRAVPFIAIAFCGVFMLLSLSSIIGKMYGTATIPVTYNILELLTGNFGLFIIIIITFYTGELVWKDITYRFSNITDALPLSRTITMTAKFVAMIAIIAFLLLMLMVTGVFLQAINGFYDFQIGVYLRQLFLNQFPYFVLITLFAFFVHNLVNNKFIGHTIVIIYYIGSAVLLSLDVRHNMWYYGNSPSLIYSDMNGFGPFLYPIYMFYLYWLGMGVFLFVVGMLLMKHGSELDLKSRFKRMKGEWKSGHGKLIIPLSLLVFLLCGGFVYYNTNIVNTYKTVKQSKQELVDYEKNYRKYLDVPQPRITAVKVNVDIYPDKIAADFKGEYTIVNKTTVAIDSIHVLLQDGTVEIKNLSFGIPSKLVDDLSKQYRIYRLEKALQPGDSTTLNFDLHYAQKGFTNDGSRTDIAANGTFLNNSMLPSIGYNEGGEMSDDDDRKELGLPEKKYRMRNINDTISYRNTYLAQDADWVRYECIISTGEDQIAISPGYLQREWVEKDRRFFQYKMDAPIVNFFSYLSARYEVFRDKWINPRDASQIVNIEIYYHPSHTFNVKTMVRGIKNTLDYASANFSNYQFNQVRILEFPRYANFAQSFPNTIPFSEGIGFILDMDKETDIDMAYYVTSHEVAHQWWGHQVCGANCQGSTVMVESMAQYTALMVMEHEYGKNNMEKFLKYELDRYLGGRSSERKKEQPLMYNENQGYIHYNKGSCVMYAMKDYLGEDKMNAALKAFVEKYHFQYPPYVTSREFVNYLREATPDSLKSIITDMFETITIYNLRATDVKSAMVKSPNGSYEVTLSIDALKARADSVGNEKPISINDWIDVGVYTEGKNGKDSLIYLQKYLFKQEKTTLKINVDAKPSKAGIDPQHKLIDRNTSDNVKKIEAAS